MGNAKELFFQLKSKISKAIKRYDDTHNFSCDICFQEVFGGERVCKKCYAKLPWNDKVICPFCGRKVLEEGACLDCKEQILLCDCARSCFTHEGEAMRLVHRYKMGEKYLYRTLAELAFPVLEREFAQADLITFVPMTAHAVKKRGYNQSQLLAEELSAKSDIPLFSGVEKTRETVAQKSLGRKERAVNLKGCFKVTEKSRVLGKRILIIDDTLTTGATSDELSRVLRKAGASAVCLLTVTSVQKKQPFGKLPEKNSQRG